ncbi:MAG: hypothetical protein HUJ26_10050 [Planctomycetaceae bacterium]|nr:hypothetical protein [Planctomycetaceae bacterium]
MIDTLSHHLALEDPECVFLPSREEIRQQCEMIRSQWSEREYLKRGYSKPTRWTAPLVSISMDSTNLPDE